MAGSLPTYPPSSDGLTPSVIPVASEEASVPEGTHLALPPPPESLGWDLREETRSARVLAFFATPCTSVTVFES